MTHSEIKPPHVLFLFSDTGCLVGAGSIINIFGNYYEFNSSDSEQEADAKAIRNDFEMVGQDIEQALKQLQPQK